MEKGVEVREVRNGGEVEGWMKVQNEVREVRNGGPPSVVPWRMKVERWWRRVVKFVKCVKCGMVVHHWWMKDLQ